MHVYIDDSETLTKNNFMCLAGFIASDRMWEIFYDEWCACLAKHNLKRIHTSDWLSGNAEYADLGYSFARRIEILQEFMEITRRNVDCGVFAALDCREFRSHFKDHKKKMKAETWLCRRIFWRSFEHMKQSGYTEGIQFWFDDSEKSSTKMLATWNELKRNWPAAQTMIGSISFGNDELLPPLQAADLLANALNRCHGTGQDPWHGKSVFAPLFIDRKNNRVTNHIRGEIWEAENFRQHEDMILNASRQK